MKLGVFYQSGHKTVACFFALQRLRQFYPEIPISFYEDAGSNVLKPVSDYFDCNYNKTDISGLNFTDYGRPVYDLKSAKKWIDNIYIECSNSLKNCDYIILFEDDVWVERRLKSDPPFELSGITGYYINDELLRYIDSKIDRNYGRGGSIFNREAFICAYEKWKSLNWDVILNIDTKPVEWSDCTITFLFDCAKKTIGSWEELVHCYTTPNKVNRNEWYNTPQEVDIHCSNAAIIHGYKAFYYPTEEEVNYVNKELCITI